MTIEVIDANGAQVKLGCTWFDRSEKYNHKIFASEALAHFPRRYEVVDLKASLEELRALAGVPPQASGDARSPLASEIIDVEAGRS